MRPFGFDPLGLSLFTSRLGGSPSRTAEVDGVQHHGLGLFSRRSLLSSLGALLLTSGCASTNRNTSLTTVLRTAMQGTAVPALGAIVIRGGRIDDFAVFGTRRLGRADQVHKDDKWLIGSCAKPMTSTMIARLVDRGILSWHTPLSEMMPELAQTMRPEYRSVTLTQLLSHQSGLPRDLDAALSSKNIFEDRRPLPQQRLEYVTLAMKEAPLFKPGTSVQYCNTGFILSGVIAERIMGVAYEDLMQREIFQPLGMSSAVFGSPLEDGPFVGHQAGHPARMSDGAPPLYGPAGPVRVTLGDWARFCLDALAGAKGKGRLLTSASYRLMQNPLPGIEDGLDWGIDASFAGRKGPVLEHSGTDRNWYALVNLFPATGDGILAVSNAGKDMGGDKAVNAAFASLFPTVSLPSSA